MKEAKNVNFEEWNIRFLRVLWITTALACFVALLLYFKFDDTEHCAKNVYFTVFVAVPTVAQISICLLMELVVRVIGRHISPNVTAMLMAVGCEMYCGTLVIVHNSVGEMAVLLIIPLMLAVIYSSRVVLVVQGVLAVAIYVLTQLVIIPNAVYMPENDAFIYIVIFVFLVAGTMVWANMMVNLQISMQDEMAGYQRREMEHEQMSRKDSLTGTWNYQAFIEKLDEQLVHFQKHSGSCVLLLFDVDGLYRINNQYGHLCGDEVIMKLAQFIQQNIRSSDYVSRYSGEKFMLILNDTVADMAERIADRIQRQFQEHSFETCNDEHYTVSVGIANWKPEYAGSLDFVSQVQKALRNAKLQGYGSLSIYED